MIRQQFDSPAGRNRESRAAVLRASHPTIKRNLICRQVRVSRGRLLRIASRTLADVVEVGFETKEPAHAAVVAYGEVERSVRGVESLHIGVFLPQIIARFGIIGPDQPNLQAVMSGSRGRVPFHSS